MRCFQCCSLLLECFTAVGPYQEWLSLFQSFSTHIPDLEEALIITYHVFTRPCGFLLQYTVLTANTEQQLIAGNATPVKWCGFNNILHEPRICSFTLSPLRDHFFAVDAGESGGMFAAGEYSSIQTLNRFVLFVQRHRSMLHAYCAQWPQLCTRTSQAAVALPVWRCCRARHLVTRLHVVNVK